MRKFLIICMILMFLTIFAVGCGTSESDNPYIENFDQTTSVMIDENNPLTGHWAGERVELILNADGTGRLTRLGPGWYMNWRVSEHYGIHYFSFVCEISSGGYSFALDGNTLTLTRSTKFPCEILTRQ